MVRKILIIDDVERLAGLYKFVSVVALICLFILCASRIDASYRFDVDSKWYIAIANGRLYEVVAPFSSRALFPLIIHSVSNFSRFSVDELFYISSFIFMICFILSCVYINYRFIPIFCVIPLLCTPFVVFLFKDYYLPDVFHAALLSVFFVLLLNESFVLCVLFLCILTIARETTILLALVLSFLAIYRHKWLVAVSSILAAIFGLVVAKWIAAFGAPNIHNIPDMAYMLLKIPYNFLKNILGIEFWSNTLFENNGDSFSHPVWTMKLPAWFHLGALQEIGINSFTLSAPLHTLLLLLTEFGLLPALLLSVLTNSTIRERLLKYDPLWAAAAIVYGVICFGLGAVSGASIERLIGYGWPCFLIGAPFLLKTYHRFDSKFVVYFLSLSLLVSWLGFFLLRFQPANSVIAVAVCFLLLLHFWVWRIANRSAIFGRGAACSSASAQLRSV